MMKVSELCSCSLQSYIRWLGKFVGFTLVDADIQSFLLIIALCLKKKTAVPSEISK